MIVAADADETLQRLLVGSVASTLARAALTGRLAFVEATARRHRLD